MDFCRTIVGLEAQSLLVPRVVGVHPRVARRGAALQRLMEVGG